MYLEYFHLNRPPFQLTPDAGFLYLSPQHAKARALMDYAVLNRDSCVVVTGDIGCGKTTLINQFLREVDEDVLVARIFQTQIDSRQFLQGLLAQFGIPAFEKDKAELLNIVNHFLLEQHRGGRQVVLIIDEAQNLSLRVLEEIRLLTDIETEQAKAINVILCGQPELNDKLLDAGMEQLLQRIHFRVHVEPLDESEMAEYIHHRLRIAGWDFDEPMFNDDVLPIIYQYTGGVPRLVNTLCDTVLTAAFVDDKREIVPDLVNAAVGELDWEPYAQRRRATDRRTFPRSDAPQPRLVLLCDGDILERFQMSERRILIGRDADNDVPIVSEFVSRNHAQISYYRGGYWLMDLKSTNGTFLNGKRVRRQRLSNKDVIAVGHHRLVFQSPEHESADDDAENTAYLSDFRGTTVLDPSYGVDSGGPDPEECKLSGS